MKTKLRKKKGQSVLDRVKNVKIEIAEPVKITPVRPLSITIPGFSMETTEVGVSEICHNKAMYLRLSLRSDT